MIGGGRRWVIATVGGIALLAGFAAVRAYDRPPGGDRTLDDLATCGDCHRREGEQTVLRDDMGCEVCHVEIADRMASSPSAHPSMNRTGERATCLDCHRFHDATAQFLPADELQSCVESNCHPDQIGEGSHPVGRINPDTGKMMTCTSDCHDPHGTRHPWFCREAPGRDLCLPCHGEMNRDSRLRAR